MKTKPTRVDAEKGLLRLITSVPQLRVTTAEAVVAKNRGLIRKAMKLGHSLDVIAKEVGVPKRTLQRHMNDAGLFFRAPRVKTGAAVKKNLAAISRLKMRLAANV